MENPTALFPLFFTFREVVSGNGFLAGVMVKGRVLMTQEDDQWCLYGVQPGGMAASGATPQEAHHTFSTSLKGILYDIAASDETYPEFEKHVREFFHAVDASDAVRWQEAREGYRSGAKIADPFIANLPKDPSEDEGSLTVERVDKRKNFTPKENVLDVFATAA